MKVVNVRKVNIHEAQPEKDDTILDEYFNERALKVYLQTTTLGFVTGIRSMSSLALLGLTSDTHSTSTQVSIKWLPLVAVLGETVADKLPFIPSRTRPGPFIGRLVIGGISGYILCRREQAPAIPGVITAILGAGAGAFASTYGRARLSKITKIPDPVLGILEDVLVTGLGTLVVRKKR
jgi:uncharacterized membrane protein